MDSILTSIKKLLGIEEEYTHFDADVIMGINTAIMSLKQIGIGASGFKITDATATWSDLVGTVEDIDGVQTFIFIKTKLIFDPPANSFAIDALKDQATELVWRLMVQVDPPVPPIIEEEVV